MPNKPTTLRELEKEFEDNCPWLGSAYEEDAKNRKWVWDFFLSHFTSHYTELLQKIEELKRQNVGNPDYEEALDDIKDFINQDK